MVKLTMNESTDKPTPLTSGAPGRLFIIIGLIFLGIILIAVLIKTQRGNLPQTFLPKKITSKDTVSRDDVTLSKFKSDEEFREYMTRVRDYDYYDDGLMRRSIPSGEISRPGMQAPNLKLGPGYGGGEVDRYSQTNVQVRGIDEPDIVKTDGREIFFSTTFSKMRPLPMREMRFEDGVYPYPIYDNQIRIIKAFPPDALADVASINKQGEMLLSDNMLMVFSNNTVHGYDITDRKDPAIEWRLNFEANTSIKTARLYKGKVYLVTSTYANESIPCPIPILKGENAIQILCTDIYHPRIDIQADVTFTTLSFDPADGKVDEKVSFVGSGNKTVVYMSDKGIYLTYTVSGNYIKVYTDFLMTEMSEELPVTVRSKIKTISGYDISSQSKLTEIQTAITKYMNTLDEDARLRIETEMQDRQADYFKKRSRDISQTGIVKVGLPNLSVAATGFVPGNPLNQFSLDEYEGNLRIATTTGGDFGRSDSTNDVYVLNGRLDIIGSVLDLGVGERIYSVRFIDDRGYVVTFKQIDPFFILDLSNPRNPQKTGELKIPGFSSYLDPLTKNRILGVGQEGSRVKLSLFDVANSESPDEVSKFMLDEYYTEVSNNHHAFLQDEKNKIFFIPASKGAYIFSYKNDEIELKKTVSINNVKRALYINNYLYILADDQIVVLDEKSWETVNKLADN